MSSIPDATLESFWTTIVDGNDVIMQAVDNTHGYDSGVTAFRADISAASYLGDPEILTGVTFAQGQFIADPAALANIMSAEFVDGVFVYTDTGSDATDIVLVFIDRNADGTDMNKEGDGSDMTAYGPGNLIAAI